LTVGAVVGSDLGCVASELFETGPLLPTSLSEAGWITFFGFFGFFGATDAGDESEPVFFFTTSVGFLVVSPPSASLVATGAVASSPDGSAGGDDSVAFVDDGVEPGDEPEEEVELSEVESAGDVLVEPVSDGPAHATPGVVATAMPTPNATARPPTRPTYLA
jgi:hypothetical protein